MKKIFAHVLLCMLAFAALCIPQAAFAADNGSFVLDGQSYYFSISDLKAADPDTDYPDIPLKDLSDNFENVGFVDGNRDQITFSKWLGRDDNTGTGSQATFICSFDTCQTTIQETMDVGQWRVPGHNTLYRDYTAEYTLTRSDEAAHSIGGWKSNGNDTHSRVCERGCGYAAETMPCSGGTATETQRAVCEVCNEEYGGLLIPETGDHANPALWVSMLAVSAVGMAAVSGRKKREY